MHTAANDYGYSTANVTVAFTAVGSSCGGTPPGGGTPPTITSVNRPDMANSGSGNYMCEVNCTSSIPATATGSNGSTGNVLFGRCSRYSRPTVSVTAANVSGSVSRAATFNCPMNLIP